MRNAVHHGQMINRKELNEMISSYQAGLDPNETKYCMLNLADIEKIISHYRDTKNLNGKNAIDGFRIYFYRPQPFEASANPEKSILKVGNKGQLSIILVPTNNYQMLPASADAMFGKDGMCMVLTPGGEHTGLCPNNCGGS
jgi:hypothetical protein